MNWRAIRARLEAYHKHDSTPAEQEFRQRAPEDVRDLLAVLAPLEPYLHHDLPTETLADVVKTIKESHERAPFITEDWHTERQDREHYQGLLAECLKTLVPLAEHDPALRELTSRLLFVVVDSDDLCEACGESDNAHTFTELLACCGGVDGIVAKVDGALEMLRTEVVE
jgi:hypothetical protein